MAPPRAPAARNLRLETCRVAALLLLLLLAAPAAAAPLRSAAERPHVVFLFCDNVGWSNVGYHRARPTREVATPQIDGLVRTGVELDRMYTYKFCSPSRSSLLSGRLPVHVNIYNDDPARPGAGVPTGMTMISEKLATAGYRGHFIGKWHVGMATRAQTPVGRGFVSSLGYFHSENDYFTQQRAEGCGGEPFVDLWDTEGPATGLNASGPDGGYEERIFTDRALRVIAAHPPALPLFLYYALHTSCVGPHGLQAPARFYEALSFIDDPDRRKNHAMIAFMDEAVGNLTAALHERGLWNNTLLVWSADNGGAVHLKGGANAFPLRGGYENNWEGGVRVAALVNGGFLPDHMRGRKITEPMHECDWFATFCFLAGVSPDDAKAAAATPPLPPVDSLNQWPLLSGANATSPRREWSLSPFGTDLSRDAHGGDAAYMLWPYKLLVGHVQQSGWCGEVHPNLTKTWDSFKSIEQCNDSSTGKIGCLFNVLDDPSERDDLAMTVTHRPIAEDILRRMQEAETHWFNPDRGLPLDQACVQARRNGGWWGPFLGPGYPPPPPQPPPPSPPVNGYKETTGIEYCGGGGDLIVGDVFGAGCMPDTGPHTARCKNPLLPAAWGDAEGVRRCEAVCSAANASACVGFTYYQGASATHGLRRCCFRTGSVANKPRCVEGEPCTARCYEKSSQTAAVAAAAVEGLLQSPGRPFSEVLAR